MKSNWNLPPGVSARDIESKTVTCPDCDGTGMRSALLNYGLALWSNYQCPRCDGTGEIPKDQLGMDE